MNEAPFVSPFQLARAQLRAFLATHRLTCACTPIELRAEGGALECAACGRVVVPVSPPGGAP